MGPCEMKTKMYHATIPNKQGSKSLRSYGEKFTWSNGAREVETSKKGAQPRSNQTKLERIEEKKRVPNKKYVSENVNTLEDTNNFVQFFTML